MYSRAMTRLSKDTMLPFVPQVSAALWERSFRRVCLPSGAQQPRLRSPDAAASHRNGVSPSASLSGGPLKSEIINGRIYLPLTCTVAASVNSERLNFFSKAYFPIDTCTSKFLKMGDLPAVDLPAVGSLLVPVSL